MGNIVFLCVVCLDNTLNCHNAYLHQVYKWVQVNLMLGGGQPRDRQAFHPEKPEISAGLMGQLAPVQTLT